MYFVLVPDSFKGGLSASQICALSKRLIDSAFPEAEVKAFPGTDGGEGSVEILTDLSGGKIVGGKVFDGNFLAVSATYGVSGDVAYIGISNTSGLPKTMIKDPFYTTSYGLGQQILQAIKLGKKKIYICLGGSSTNDGGAGASAALGAVFKNKSDEKFVPTGGNLNEIESADLSELKKNICGVEFIGLCDVKNPLLGKNGCSYVYAKQKGAKEETLKTLDDNMEYFARIISGDDFVDFPGAGAAGGLGFFVKNILGGEIMYGAEHFLDIIDFDANVKKADFIITGEGKFDATSSKGKICGEVAERCAENGKRATVFCGINGTDAIPNGVSKVIEINDKTKSLSENIAEGENNFIKAFSEFLNEIKNGQEFKK